MPPPDVKTSVDLINILLGNSGSGLIILVLVLYRLGVLRKIPFTNGNGDDRLKNAKSVDIGEKSSILNLQSQINELHGYIEKKIESIFNAMDRKNTDLMNQINGLSTNLAIYNKEVSTIGDICKNLESLNKEWYREHCENHPRSKK